jgi:hypothetical protein
MYEYKKIVLDETDKYVEEIFGEFQNEKVLGVYRRINKKTCQDYNQRVNLFNKELLKQHSLDRDIRLRIDGNIVDQYCGDSVHYINEAQNFIDIEFIGKMCIDYANKTIIPIDHFGKLTIRKFTTHHGYRSRNKQPGLPEYRTCKVPIPIIAANQLIGEFSNNELSGKYIYEVDKVSSFWPSDSKYITYLERLYYLNHFKNKGTYGNRKYKLKIKSFFDILSIEDLNCVNIDDLIENWI